MSTKDLKEGTLRFYNLDFTGTSKDFRLFRDDFVTYSENELTPLVYDDLVNKNDLRLPYLYKSLLSYKEKFIISLAKFSYGFLTPFEKCLEKTFNKLSSIEMFYLNLVNKEEDKYAISISCFLDSSDTWNNYCIQLTVHKTDVINKNFFLFSKKIFERKEILQFNLKYNPRSSWENVCETLDYTIVSPEYLDDCIGAISIDKYSIVKTNLICISENNSRYAIDDDRKQEFVGIWKNKLI